MVWLIFVYLFKASNTRHRWSIKQLYVKTSQILQKNNCVGVSFWIKFQAWHLRDSDTGVFLWVLWYFWEQLFLRKPPVAGSKISVFVMFVVVYSQSPQELMTKIYIGCYILGNFGILHSGGTFNLLVPGVH